jgi:hypothetical protein
MEEAMHARGTSRIGMKRLSNTEAGDDPSDRAEDE